MLLSHPSLKYWFLSRLRQQIFLTIYQHSRHPNPQIFGVRSNGTLVRTPNMFQTFLLGGTSDGMSTLCFHAWRRTTFPFQVSNWLQHGYGTEHLCSNICGRWTCVQQRSDYFVTPSISYVGLVDACLDVSWGMESDGLCEGWGYQGHDQASRGWWRGGGAGERLGCDLLRLVAVSLCSVLVPITSASNIPDPLKNPRGFFYLREPVSPTTRTCPNLYPCGGSRVSTGMGTGWSIIPTGYPC